jgi:hypothetical protein
MKAVQYIPDIRNAVNDIIKVTKWRREDDEYKKETMLSRIRLGVTNSCGF